MYKRLNLAIECPFIADTKVRNDSVLCKIRSKEVISVVKSCIYVSLSRHSLHVGYLAVEASPRLPECHIYSLLVVLLQVSWMKLIEWRTEVSSVLLFLGNLFVWFAGNTENTFAMRWDLSTVSWIFNIIHFYAYRSTHGDLVFDICMSVLLDWWWYLQHGLQNWAIGEPQTFGGVCLLVICLQNKKASTLLLPPDPCNPLSNYIFRGP